MNQRHVLVTGGSGFIAGHCILQLLADGHLVRATLRSISGETAARAALEQAGMVQGGRLSFVAADLLRNDGWAGAMRDIDAVLHVASPVQPGHVANEDDLIVPAQEGTLRVLRAARDAGVGRVVLTSAFHAVSWGHPHRAHVFTEADWTVLDGPGVDAYGKSKTIAERAAWDFIAQEGGTLELVTMLPVAVMGPVIGHSVTGANHIIQRMLRGAMPGFPNLFIPIVDVRDVARAHILALGSRQAAGERFLISNGVPLAMKEIGAIIRDSVDEAASSRLPTRSLPDLMIRFMALFRPELRHYVPDLGYAKKTTNEKSRNLLGWVPRPAEEAIAAAAQSMVRSGLG
ncbi:aldehyde reductase [Novosphingobium profundi]|uniref:SDR family oxidoreductase n=1 Tax=Novosphingobium profundi TaxID=1774954 RepID=UPI001BD9CEB9|nr:aldehyde reductase [Novosphingobium profundi]MBT0668124.1 aldehyde reductase [Novosphingobium profundi]